MSEAPVATPADPFLAPEAVTWPEAERQARLLGALNDLTARHAQACAPYGRILAAQGGAHPAARLEDVPYLAAGLFKTHRLASIGDDEVFTTLTSSGTTGQAVSRILLDTRTADLQARGLAAGLRPLLGGARLPMLILDTEALLRGPAAFSARAAGVLGLMRFGRRHVFALDADMALRRERVAAFLDAHGGEPFLIFGFTFMVWRHFAMEAEAAGLDLSNGLLLHSGGWKTLQDIAVDDAAFRAGLKARFGLSRIHNFYGMVEQIGALFLQGEDGRLHPPPFAHAIIRDPVDRTPLPPGETGAVQVLSALPWSYPGHSLLTEDLGRITPGADGRPGLEIFGRIPRSELRGCGDAHGQGLAA